MKQPNGGSERFRRGSYPPSLPLSEAFSLAHQIYEQGGGEASLDMISRLTGNSRSSSALGRKIAALKGFGLVEDSANGTLTLTDIGYSIVAPRNAEVEALGKQRAFLGLEVFAKVFERHKGKLLPADEFLKNIIEQDCQIPRELSPQWVSAFREAAQASDLLFRRSDGKIQILESPFPTVKVPDEPEEIIVESPKAEPQAPIGTFPDVATTGHTTRIEVSGKRYAVFSVPDNLTKRDAHKLKGALAGLGTIIDSMISDEVD